MVQTQEMRMRKVSIHSCSTQHSPSANRFKMCSPTSLGKEGSKSRLTPSSSNRHRRNSDISPLALRMAPLSPSHAFELPFKSKRSLSHQPRNVGVSAPILPQEKRGDEHALARKWVLWEHVAGDDQSPRRLPRQGSVIEDGESYMSGCRQIGSCTTIEEFMRLHNGMPKPSTCINKHRIIRKTKMDDNQRRGSILGVRPMREGDDPNCTAETIGALMYFQDGVQPSWEDPVHAKGGHMQFVFKTDFDGGVVDEIWERLLFSILGNLIPNGDAITGIRMADKLQIAHASNDTIAVPAIRVEVWYSHLPADGVPDLRKSLLNIIKAPVSAGGHVKCGRSIRKGDGISKTTITYQSKARRMQSFEERKDRRCSV